MTLDLAREARFALGAMEVRPSTREVVVGGRSQVLEPRIMQVLVVLAGRRGEVVSRDELIALCWDGRSVGDDAIARCIAAIRRLAEAYGGFSVETVARVGYRLDDLTGRSSGNEAAGTPADAATIPAVPHPQIRRRPLAWIIAALAVLVLAAAGVLWTFRDRLPLAPKPGAPDTRVAVLPFDVVGSSQEARNLASGVVDDLVGDLSADQIEAISRTESDALRGPTRDREIERLGVGLMLGGLVQSEAETLRVRVHLDVAREHVTIWSAEFEGAPSEERALRTQIAGQIAGVLACSRRAPRATRGLSDPAFLGRYIHACEIWSSGRVDSTAVNAILEDYRAIAAHAPNSADAHSDLAENDALLQAGAPADQAPALRREAALEARKALALDPASGQAYVTMALLAPPTDWAPRERLLRKGVSVDPAWAESYEWLGFLFRETGRLNEASELLQKNAAGESEFSFASANAEMMCETGKTDEGINALANVRKVWPKSWVAWADLITCFEWAGRWREAGALFHDPASRPPLDPRTAEALDAAIAAHETHTATDIAKARRVALSIAPNSELDSAVAIEALAGLGLVDDAFILAGRSASAGTMGDHVADLFDPSTAALRRDLRFMPLAARLGLVDYWRSSGHWPDFCSEPGLPYDCKVEAAKLAAAKPTSLRP